MSKCHIVGNLMSRLNYYNGLTGSTTGASIATKLKAQNVDPFRSKRSDIRTKLQAPVDQLASYLLCCFFQCRSEASCYCEKAISKFSRTNLKIRIIRKAIIMDVPIIPHSQV